MADQTGGLPIEMLSHWVDSLYTDSSEMFVESTQLEANNYIRINVRVLTNDDIIEIVLYSIVDGDEIKVPLKKTYSDGTFDWWTVGLEAYHSPFVYKFKVLCNNYELAWNGEGLSLYDPSDAYNFKYYFNHSLPTWVEDAVFYQIFVDRFKQGGIPKCDQEELVALSELTKGIDRVHLQWSDDTHNQSNEFCGGNLYGVGEKLKYLRGLGINTVYLSPVFLSPSNHKFDVQDYMRVDPDFGCDNYLSRLIKVFHRVNIRTVLEGVFNHTSARHSWFNKHGVYPAQGAFEDQHSEYFGYYSFVNHPKEYDSFWGLPEFPKLNYASMKLRQEIYGLTNSVMSKWMGDRYNVDGWRLDTFAAIAQSKSQQLNQTVMSEFYENSKALNRGCFIIGEHPFDPSGIVPYLHLDGTTNYAGFYNPVKLWLKNPKLFSAERLAHCLTRYRAQMGEQFVRSSLNFLCNHDTVRLYSCLGDPRIYKLGVILMFAYFGVPCIYYGEEVKLRSSHTQDENQFGENDSRLPMNWSVLANEKSTFKFYQKLIRTYRKHRCLRVGGYMVLSTKNNVFSFIRFDSTEHIIIVLNNNTRSQRVRLNLRKTGIVGMEKLTCLLNPNRHCLLRGCELTIEEIAPYEGLVLRVGH